MLEVYDIFAKCKFFSILHLMHTLTFSGKTITSLTDIYDLVMRELHLDREIFGKNLDALFDVLASSSLSKIFITENLLLKEHLSKVYKNEHTEYELFLDVLTDLEGVEIVIG